LTISLESMVLMKPNTGFNKHELDLAISDGNIKMLGELIHASITQGHIASLTGYIKGAIESTKSITSGVALLAILEAFGMQGLKGIDICPLEVLGSVQDLSSEDALESGRSRIMRHLECQVRRRNTFFLDIGELQKSEAAVLVSDIVSAREAEVRDLCKGRFTEEEFASTYYGFLVLTSPTLKRNSVLSLENLLECLNPGGKMEFRMHCSELNPEHVLFRNASRTTEEILRSILYLTCDNSNERAKAANYLGETGDPRVECYLVHATRDRYAWVRKAAVIALGRIRVLETPEAVVDVLKDVDEDTRSSALESLVSIGSPVVPSLVSILGSYNGFCHEELVEIVSKSHPRSLDSVEAMVDSHSYIVRKLAAKALGRIGGNDAVQALESAMQDEEPEIRISAQRAIKELHGRAVGHINRTPAYRGTIEFHEEIHD
jgi:HEAT repeat protein